MSDYNESHGRISISALIQRKRNTFGELHLDTQSAEELVAYTASMERALNELEDQFEGLLKEFETYVGPLDTPLSGGKQ